MSLPKLKLKIGSNIITGSATSPPLSTPSTALPTPKLKFTNSTKPPTPSEPLATPTIKFGNFSKIQTPSVPPPTPKTKAGRAPKPSAKVVANKNGKRKSANSEDDDIGSTIEYIKKPTTASQPKAKKIKLSLGPKTPATPITPFIKIKHKGKPPKRPLGEGYDSEASDREIDPSIEEEFILRMMPGPDCDYLRQMIDQKKIGLKRVEGGADVQMKFLLADGRRAAITVRGHHYAATLVDLPTITEGMKSWDKKGWYKSADICQMLWVFSKISYPQEALTIDLPKEVDPKTFAYPHGLTAPMVDARRRRFRKRISRTAIEAVEDAVELLLEADAKAESSTYEILEPEGSRQQSQVYSMSGEPADEDEDAEGEEEDYFGHINGNGVSTSNDNIENDDADADEDDDEALDLEAELEAAFDEGEMEAGTPASQDLGKTPDVSVLNGGTPDASGMQDDSGDDSSGGEDEDEEEDAEGDELDVDEDERERLAQVQGAKEDIADMEKQLVAQQAQLAGQSNALLQRRVKDNIAKIKAELELKKAALGEGDEE